MQADNQAQSRHDGRSSSRERESLHVRYRPKRYKRSFTYDLVNCGPRHQFVIRNDLGESFISHNSIGHGLNLQYGSNTIAWYGLTPDMELYSQFNGRIADRQGQTKPVTIHHILAENTVDFLIQKMLQVKIEDVEGLRHAIKAYQQRAG